MPNYTRIRHPGATVFFTVNAYRRRPIFLNPDFRIALREGIQQTRKDKPFKILAWVLLHDHLHCIWQLPENDQDISKRWSQIKRLVSQKISCRYKTLPNTSRSKRNESSIWQRRFWEHHIFSEDDYITHLNYCYMNPVKHGLVTHVKDWEFSTFHRDVNRGLFPKDWFSQQDLDGQFESTVE
ncbi:MAG: REP-associated tyrosine transposase [Oleiphilus sp.]